MSTPKQYAAIVRLDAAIRTTFCRSEDIDFEEGFCNDWAAMFIAFLSLQGVRGRLVVAYEPDDVVGGTDSFSHCMVWVPCLEQCFDWRGAEAHTRWTGRVPSTHWMIRDDVESFIFPDVLGVRAHAFGRLALTMKQINSPQLVAA